MKKWYARYILLFLFVLSYSVTHAQLSGNTWLMGGYGSFSSLKSNSDEVYFKRQSTTLLSGNLGYFFIDKFATGLKLSYANEKTVVDGGMPETENLGVNRNLQFGPFVRYYLLNTDLPYNISTEVSVEFGQNTGKVVPLAAISKKVNSSE